MEIGPEARQEIEGSEANPENEIPWKPLEGSMPMSLVERGSYVIGSAVGIAGIVWLYIIGGIIAGGIKEGSAVIEVLFLSFIGLPGVFCLLYGIGQFVSRREIMIERERVSVVNAGLRGRRGWSEPISAFKGVIRRHRYSSGPRDRSRRTVYTVALSHEDTDKEIVLFRVSSRLPFPPEQWEKDWKHYAALFELPLIEETAEGIVSARLGDIDAPLIGKIRRDTQGILKPDQAMENLGRMVSVEREDDAWVLTFQYAWTFWKTALGLAVMVLALAAVFYFRVLSPKLVMYFALIIPLIALFSILSIRSKLAHPEQVAVDKDAFWYRYWQKPRGWITRRIGLDKISEISVKPAPGDTRGRIDLVVAGGGTEVRFGYWLPGKTKSKVKELLLSLIAEAHEINVY
jgi:hypothetical protein